tara:strand:- start:195 stop:668 length:474 start_codon:yes stop_codon:yes gene_type:complete
MVYSLVMPAAISFTGYRHRKKLVRNAVEWFLPKYVGKHILNIEIYDKQMNREGTNGACSFLGSFKKPRRFFIEMNNSLDDNEYLQSLFHELIHMKQWIFRQRITTKNHNDYWYGKLIGDEIDYMELPWEKEAYQLENSVFLWYLRSQGNTIEDKFKK